MSHKVGARAEEGNKRNCREIEITDEGDVDKYLGVKIEKQENGTIKMYQIISDHPNFGNSRIQ